MELLSVIVPCYNEEAALPFFLKEIRATADSLEEKHGLACELIFVDDGSSDGTLGLLRQYSREDKRVRYLSFSRNFGKEAALYAGFSHAKGGYVVVMDADLQHPPAMLEEMYLSLQDGEYDVAAARRVSRKGEPPIRSFFSRLFYKVINKISKAEFVDGASDFRMLTRRAVDALLQMREYNRFSKGIFGWVGFRTKWFAYENIERAAGQTKWNFWKLFRYSIEGIVGFSTAPLAAAALLGVLFCLAALVMIGVIIVRTLVFGDPTSGWPSMVCIILLCSGVQLFCTGVLGEYLAKTYLEVKRRPLYLVREGSEDPDPRAPQP